MYITSSECVANAEKKCVNATVSKSYQKKKNKEELNWSLLEILKLSQCWLKVQIRARAVYDTVQFEIFFEAISSSRLSGKTLSISIFIFLLKW